LKETSRKKHPRKTTYGKRNFRQHSLRDLDILVKDLQGAIVHVLHEEIHPDILNERAIELDNKRSLGGAEDIQLPKDFSEFSDLLRQGNLLEKKLRRKERRRGQSECE
jgi:hypothetical protein